MHKKLFVIYLSIMLLTCYLQADIKSLDGEIKFDSNANGQAEVKLDATGLHIGPAGSANLNVTGNAIVSEISVGGSNGSGSNLHIHGTLSKTFAVVTGNATLGEVHNTVLLNLSSASANVDIEMPPAGNVIGQLFDLKVIGGNVTTLVRAPENIDQYLRVDLGNLSSTDLSSSIKLLSTGTQWYIMSGYQASSVNNTISITDNLIAHWPFDEKSGSVAHDVSGYGHHAYFQEGLSESNTWGEGQINGGIYLDGSGHLEPDANINLTNTSFTVSFWVKRDSTGTDYIFSYGRGSSGDGLHLGYLGSNAVRFGFWANDVDTVTTFGTTEWRHWTFTYDRDTNQRIIYLNGVVERDVTTGSAFTPINKNTYIGSRFNSAKLSGTLDDMRVYNKVLKPEEVSELYLLESMEFEFAPELTTAIAYGTNNSSTLTNGDNLILSFSGATNEPNLVNKSSIDAVIEWNGKSLGAAYSATWSDNKTLVITLDDITGFNLIEGDRIEIKPSQTLTLINNSGIFVKANALIEINTFISLSDNLLAYYPFEALTESKFFDHANSRHLSVTGGPTIGPAQVGNGVTFSGNDVALTSGVNIANSNFTIMFWEKKNTFGVEETLLSLGESSSTNVLMRVSYDDTDFFEHDLWGGLHDSSDNITTSEWRHWAVTFNKDNFSKSIYLNGNLNVGSHSSETVFTGTNVLHVGSQITSGEFTTSSLDELRIYNKELSQEAIQFIYNNNLVDLSAPSLISAVANDPQRDIDGITNGDNLTLSFDRPTNEVTVATKSDIDDLIDLKNYSLGMDYSGVWMDNLTLAITVINATGANLQTGFSIDILSSANLLNAAQTSSASNSTNVTISGNWGIVSSDNLLAYLPFDETSGLVATEMTSGRNGILDAGMDDSDWVAGFMGNGINLDGTSDEVTIGNGNINIANSSFTTSVWVYRHRNGVEEYLFSQGSGTGNGGLHFGFRSDSRFTLAFWSNDAHSLAFTAIEQWHHWVCTFDASTKLQSIYLNGHLMATRTSSSNYLGTGDFIIGSRFSASLYLDATVDEVLIYDYALDASEVRSLHDSY